MADNDNKKIYDVYKRKVKKCPTELPCPLCESFCLLPSDFKEHFQTEHPDLQHTCCWCACDEYSWTPRRKFRMARHLHECFNRLFVSVRDSKQIRARGPAAVHDYGSGSSHAKVRKTRPTGNLRAVLKKFQRKVASLSTRKYPCSRHQQQDPCSQQVKLGAMERHFVDCHAPFDPAVACVWCDGAFVWPRGQKNRNVEHLSRCFESYSEKVKRLEREVRKNEGRRLQPQPDYEFAGTNDDDPLPRLSGFSPSLVGNMLGRDRILPDYAYGPLFQNIDAATFPLCRVTNSIEFEDVVEKARYYLDLYCQWNRVRKDDDDGQEEREEDGTVATWYHAVVSAFAFDRFVRAVREFGTDKVFALPFWCWCDRGKHREAIFRHHRHMILVVRNGCRFKEDCWRKLSRVVHNKQYRKRKKKGKAVDEGETSHVERDQEVHEDGSGAPNVEEVVGVTSCDVTFNNNPPLPDGYYMGRVLKIDTWLRLVNTMRYLSQRQSACHYSFERDCLEKGSRKRKRKSDPWEEEIQEDRHFCFGSDWHCLGMLCLACVASRNGLQTLLDQENRSRSLDPRFVFRWPSPKNGPWHVRVGDLKTGFHEVLPVKKMWRPVKIISPDDRTAMDCSKRTAFLYLMDGKKLVFERDPSLESLSDSQWRRVQAKEGCGGDDDGSSEYAAAKNLFYDVIADARWKASRRQQEGLNFGEKYAGVLTERLEATCEGLKGEIESLKGEMGLLKVEKESFKEEIESLKRRLWANENRTDVTNNSLA